MNVQEHYQRLLAEEYDFVFGGFTENSANAAALLGRLNLQPSLSGRALDLGCGPGYYAAPLAQAGYSVQALDWEPTLLASLADRCAGMDVVSVRADMREFVAHCKGPVELVLCMGDSLAHLTSSAEVSALLRQAAEVLEPGGRLLLSFRDQSRALIGADRFLTLRSDAQRIFSCFIEFAEESLEVTDILHVRQGQEWAVRKSAYRKTRLTGGQVEAMCRAAGLEVELRVNEAGLITLLACKFAQSGESVS
ncbi:MAG: class I SAM-dependent methyltransferase [Desulfovibrionaceae bacterium]